MAEVVSRQLILHAVDFNLAVLDAVGIASDAGTKVAGRVHRVGILSDVVEPQHHVGELSVLVGHHQRHHATAEVSNAHLHAVMVFQGEEFHGLLVNHGVEGSRIEARCRQLGFTCACAGRAENGCHSCREDVFSEIMHNCFYDDVSNCSLSSEY